MDRRLTLGEIHRDRGDCSTDSWGAIRVEIDHRATEYDVGSASGLPTQPMTATEMVDRFGAEDPDEFAARVRSLLDDLSEREGGGLLVSHAGVGRMIHTLRQGRKPSEFRDQSLPENAALFLI